MAIVTSTNSNTTSGSNDDVQANEASADPTERTASMEVGPESISETPAIATQTNVHAANQRAYAYLVIGFRSRLRGRCVQLAQPLSGIRVCSGCRVLPHKAMLLPCSHILCFLCCDKYLDDMTELTGEDDDSDEDATPTVRCPEDCLPYAASDLLAVDLDSEYLRGLSAFCVNSKFGCPLKAEVRYLEEHYPVCPYGRRTCVRCRRSDIPTAEILLHTFHCGRR
ncbi:hypothetical protein HPB52_017428 [Rhipicephalus sanguineus]|uniref:Uncharacterized protein n=1 Tax=Rhipicephalus sanguineus TaxID=34632 RepID=A0A9D4PE15_RHISA|nr:hypothetical protein HPB52_017428 [Rhipicephalus sanguineus]